jgi:hypothetical protein
MPKKKSFHVLLTTTWIVANTAMAQNRPKYASAAKPPINGVKYKVPTKFDTMLAACGLLMWISVVK